MRTKMWCFGTTRGILGDGIDGSGISKDMVSEYRLRPSYEGPTVFRLSTELRHLEGNLEYESPMIPVGDNEIRIRCNVLDEVRISGVKSSS
jgi:hypothetical protein